MRKKCPTRSGGRDVFVPARKSFRSLQKPAALLNMPNTITSLPSITWLWLTWTRRRSSPLQGKHSRRSRLSQKPRAARSPKLLNSGHEKCPHRAALACAVPVIRWSAETSSDKLRQCARCTAGGHKGATIQHPGWGGADDRRPRTRAHYPPGSCARSCLASPSYACLFLQKSE